MKKRLLLLLVINITCFSAWSQLKPGFSKTKGEIQTKTTATTTTPDPPVYSLTAAKVTIKTGSDNKEFPSGLYIQFWLKDHSWNTASSTLLFRIQDLRNEMAVNSTTELGLPKYAGTADKYLLSNIQKNGLELEVFYVANFFMDAWKIENISCTLEFRDQNGNLHPTLGSKTINFSNANGFLNNEYAYFRCTTDQNFNPLMAAIGKYSSSN